MPQHLPGERIEAEDFAAASGEDAPSIQHDVDEIVAFYMCRPDLLPGSAIQRDDRPSDADEDQF